MRLFQIVVLSIAVIWGGACSTTSPERSPDDHWIERAWAEYRGRGGSISRDQARATVRREKQRIQVSYEFVPQFPGGHFSVTFDEGSGKLISYLPGY